MKIFLNPAVSNINNSGKVSHKGQFKSPEKIGFTTLNKITSEAEYDKILEKLKNSGCWFRPWNKGNKFETGIMPYAGLQDISSEINCFLRNGETNMNRYMLEDIVRILDYALNEIDKTYGKYKGFVYRYGFVDNITKNYVSTARDPIGAVSQIENRRRCTNPFYIIQTENGHKIEEVQKKLDYNSIYVEESEILLNPATYFQEINYLAPEFKEAKEKLLLEANKARLNPIPQIKFLKEI